MPSLEEIRAKLAGAAQSESEPDLDEPDDEPDEDEDVKLKGPPPVWSGWERRGKCRLAKDRSDALVEFGKFSGMLVSDMVKSPDSKLFVQWLVKQHNPDKKWPPKPLVEICQRHLKLSK